MTIVDYKNNGEEYEINNIGEKDDNDKLKNYLMVVVNSDDSIFVIS